MGYIVRFPEVELDGAPFAPNTFGSVAPMGWWRFTQEPVGSTARRAIRNWVQGGPALDNRFGTIGEQHVPLTIVQTPSGMNALDFTPHRARSLTVRDRAGYETVGPAGTIAVVYNGIRGNYYRIAQMGGAVLLSGNTALRAQSLSDQGRYVAIGTGTPLPDNTLTVVVFSFAADGTTTIALRNQGVTSTATGTIDTTDQSTLARAQVFFGPRESPGTVIPTGAQILECAYWQGTTFTADEMKTDIIPAAQAALNVP